MVLEGGMLPREVRLGFEEPPSFKAVKLLVRSRTPIREPTDLHLNPFSRKEFRDASP